MHIGVIGWYGHHNAGDERILYCLRRFFQPATVSAVSIEDTTYSALDRLNRCDFVLFGGGGLVLRGGNTYAQFLEQVHAPFGCVGISIEAVHPDNKKLIETIITKSKFVLVRDPQSYRMLDRHSKVVPTADLTFLFPYRCADESEERVCGLNLRHWLPWNVQLNGRVYRTLYRLNTRHPRLARFVPVKRWKPSLVVEAIREQCPSILAVPLYCPADESSDRRVLASTLGGSPASFDASDYCRVRYFVGMRLHSIIFACQMNRPFVSISYQPKNVEFCRAIGLESMSVSPYRLHALEPCIRRMSEEYGSLRNRMAAATASMSTDVTEAMSRAATLMGIEVCGSLS